MVRTMLAALVAALLILGGCAGLPGPLGSLGAKTYRCHDGKTFTVRYADEERTAILNVDGRELRLTRKKSASGAQYGDGRTTFATRGSDALIEASGVMTHHTCSLVSK